MMDQILTIRLYAAGIGIVVGEFLGSFDDLLYAASRAFARKSASSPLSAWRTYWIPTSSEAAVSCALP